MLENKKAFLDISFSWIFAIVVGVIILVGAIYGIVKFSEGISSQTTTEDAKELINLFNGLETSFESATVSSITLPINSRIYLSCESFTKFGSQGLSISQKLKNKWTDRSIEVEFKNNYVFSESIEEGKEFYAFSKPFEFPFKIATLIYLIPLDKDYCFMDPPHDIEEEIEELNQPNLIFEEDCQGDEIKVCFRNSQNCDIVVNSDRVIKGEKILHYEEDALMYAAIFSDSEIYECNLQRLMQRASFLSKIYQEKAEYLFIKGCSTNMASDLISYESKLNSFETSEDIHLVNSDFNDLERKNKYVECKLW